MIPHQLQSSVARRVLGNFDFDVARHIVLGEPAQLLANPFSRDPGGTRVPDRERCDPVGVNMLGRLDQLGETRQRISSLAIARTIHLNQNRKVTLHDEGVLVAGGGRHSFSSNLALQ